MAIGIMEVHLVKAKGLHSNCFFGGMKDPYVLLQYEGQKHRSNIAKGRSRNCIWNETFLFKVEDNESNDKHKLILKVMDKDSLSADDFIGQAIIYVKDLVAQGVQNGVAKISPLKYRVIRENKFYRGEIDVGITFTRTVTLGSSVGELIDIKRAVKESQIRKDTTVPAAAKLPNLSSSSA